jgi:hypothetical protein
LIRSVPASLSRYPRGFTVYVARPAPSILDPQFAILASPARFRYTATGLSSGILTVSAKTGFVIETATNRQAMEYFMQGMPYRAIRKLQINFPDADLRHPTSVL